MPVYPDGGSARHSDPSPSHEAAARLDVTKLEGAVLETVRKYGRNQRLCVVEIWKRMPEHPIDSISPRMKKLVGKGRLLQHPKEPRANRYGNLRNQLVYSYVHPLKLLLDQA